MATETKPPPGGTVRAGSLEQQVRDSTPSGAFMIGIGLVLAACTSPLFSFDRAVWRPPLEQMVGVYDAVRECLGVPASADRVRWFEATGLTFDGESAAGVWAPPHDIYLIPDVWISILDNGAPGHVGRNFGAHAVGHEAVHDLLQVGIEGHGRPEFARCEDAGLILNDPTAHAGADP